MLAIHILVPLSKKIKTDLDLGSFQVKSPNPPHLTPIDFVEILSDESIHQEMEILKILSLYHFWYRNHDQMKYRLFRVDTEPLKLLSI